MKQQKDQHDVVVILKFFICWYIFHCLILSFIAKMIYLQIEHDELDKLTKTSEKVFQNIVCIFIQISDIQEVFHVKNCYIQYVKQIMYIHLLGTK